jgi:hypothetical protein
MELLKQLGEVAQQIWPILLIIGAIIVTLALPEKKLNK